MEEFLKKNLQPQNDLNSQAQHIWNMLDEMAQSDPQGYKKFVNKQLEEGKKAMSPPRPHMCIQTTIINNSEANNILYINICEWQRIPNPESDEDPIPCVGGPIYTVKDQSQNRHKATCVAFGSKVLKDFGIKSTKREEHAMLINLAIDYVQDQLGLKLSRSYVELPETTLYRGSLKQILINLDKSSKKDEDEFSEQLSELEKSFGPMAAGCKDTLLAKMANMCSFDDDPPMDESNSNHTNQNDINLSTDFIINNQQNITKPTNTKPLIEELSAEKCEKTKPEYELTLDETQNCAVVNIYLPEITSVTQCELDITSTEIQLQTDLNDELHLALPYTIDQDKSKAKFSKKRHKLTLTLPLDTPAT